MKTLRNRLKLERLLVLVLLVSFMLPMVATTVVAYGVDGQSGEWPLSVDDDPPPLLVDPTTITMSDNQFYALLGVLLTMIVLVGAQSVALFRSAPSWVQQPIQLVSDTLVAVLEHQAKKTAWGGDDVMVAELRRFVDEELTRQPDNPDGSVVLPPDLVAKFRSLPPALAT